MTPSISTANVDFGVYDNGHGKRKLHPQLCACGCGCLTSGKRVGPSGKPARFINGHHLHKIPKPTIWSPYLDKCPVQYNDADKRWKCKLRGTVAIKNHARAVYEHYYGEIPPGFDVHHKNGDATRLECDNPENLMLIPSMWNSRVLPILSFGFGVPEKEITDIYIGLSSSVKPEDLFPEICRELLKKR